MILITGGLGFIGSHTARAVLDLGEPCIVTRHTTTEVPAFLQADLGTRLTVESLDVDDEAAWLGLGKHHQVTGIVHLADPGVHRLWRRPGEEFRWQLDHLFDGLLHVLEAAQEWGVPRVTIASTVGVYGGLVPGRWSEEQPLPMLAAHAIPTVKKCWELLASFISDQIGVEVISVRPCAIWGPGGRTTSSLFALPALVHTAVSGAPAPAPTPQPLYALDGGDLCYVKDCGRAIALIQTTEKLNHCTYNIGSGRATTNEQVVAAIRHSIPEATFEITDGRNPDGQPVDPVLDLTRIREDTGYEPTFDIQRGIADYISWLRAGHDR